MLFAQRGDTMRYRVRRQTPAKAEAERWRRRVEGVEGAEHMADRTPVPRDPEDERADLMATLAAARELGPEMDKSIADSYLERDRKSTRLNSSHVEISYAVFCLKKEISERAGRAGH